MKRLPFIAFSLLISLILNSQVTIGSGESAVKGAILDLKEKKTINGVANSSRGLALPRVKLTSLTSLNPCATNSDSNKKSHVGLVVYNAEGPITLSPGLYVWNGKEWQSLKEDELKGLGPWYAVETQKPTALNNKDAYLNAKAVIGGTSLVNNATLSVSNDAKISGNIGIEGPTIIGIKSTDINKGALLDLREYDDAQSKNGGRTSAKGYLMPRVILTNINNLDPLITGGGTVAQKKSYIGTTVYHLGGNGIEVGQRLWDGVKWLEIITEIPPPEVVQSHHFELIKDAIPVASHPAETHLNGKATLLEFGEKNAADQQYYIPINIDGSYAFSVRMYGNANPKNNGRIYTRATFYLTLMVNGVKKDVQEINQSCYPQNLKIDGTSVLVGDNLHAGDKVQIKFSYFNQADNSDIYSNSMILITRGPGDMRADKTTLLYWQL